MITNRTKSLRSKNAEKQQEKTQIQPVVQPVGVPGYMLGLQRQHGNRFVQRMVRLSRQDEGEISQELEKEDQVQPRSITQRQIQQAEKAQTKLEYGVLQCQTNDQEEIKNRTQTKLDASVIERQADEKEQDQGAIQSKPKHNLLQRQFDRKKQDANATQAQTITQHTARLSPERAWAVNNPKGMVSELGQNHFILENFDISSAELKPEHIAKLDAMARDWQIINLRGDASIQIDGHASGSGGKNLNQALSNRRAQAVAKYLISHRVMQPAIKTRSYGYSQPLFPNINGRLMARNRRVEVRIAVPQYEQPEQKPIFEPPPQKKSLAPQDSELGQLLPNGEFAIKVPIDPKVPISYGSVLIYPSGEINGIFKLETQRPETIRGYWESGKLGFYATEKLTEGVAFKIDSKNIGFSFNGAPFSPEVMWNLVEIHKPLSINFAQKVNIGSIDFGGGIKGIGAIELKMKFGVGPNPIYGALGIGSTSGGITFGAAAGTILITYGVASLVKQAGEEGLQWGHNITKRSAYALRLAAEVTGDHGTNPPLEITDSLDHLKQSETWEYAWQGWQIADAGLRGMTLDQRNRLIQSLRKRYGTKPLDIYEAIFQVVGGTSHEDKPLPLDPQELLR